MKLIFLILLISNVLLGVTLWQSESRRAPAPVVLPLPELQPDRIKLLAVDHAKRGAGNSKGSAATPPANGTTSGATRGTTGGGGEPVAPPSAEAVARAGPSRACTEWGVFKSSDVPRAMRLVESTNATARSINQRVEGGASYWVYIPPLPTRRQAELRIAELKPTRIDEYYVVLDEGRFANAISLGVFSTEAGAQSRREALDRLGVSDAVVGPRESVDARIFLRILDVPESMVPRLIALRGAFAGTDFKDCSAEAVRGG